MQVFKDGKDLNCVIRYSTKSKIYLRAKENFVLITCPKKTPNKYIEELVLRYFDDLYNSMLKKQKQEIIHYNGVGYIPKFFIANKNQVVINGNEIWLCAKKSELEAYKKVLHEFYKKELINEVNKIIDEAKKDFSDITNFPTIEFSYMSSMFGNYTRRKHRVKLSTMLIKYDFKFIKYVLYHELSHVYEANHSDKFYKVFVSKYPKAIEVRKELKKIKYYDYI